MTSTLSRLIALSILVAAGAAQAQTVPAVPPPEATQPDNTKPNAITPPNGVARGVIRPNRPVDSKMVTSPPNRGQHRMPVITPPGVAR